MAWKRIKIGDVCKNKNKPGTHLKVYKDHVLKDGQYINFESKKEKLAGIEAARESGKITEEHYQKSLSIIEKMPDFVLFEAYILEQT